MCHIVIYDLFKAFVLSAIAICQFLFYSIFLKTGSYLKFYFKFSEVGHHSFFSDTKFFQLKPKAYLMLFYVLKSISSDASFGYPGGPLLFRNLNFGIDLDSRIASKYRKKQLIFCLQVQFVGFTKL